MLLDPARIYAGETTEWTLSLAAYPASEWTVKLAASNAAGAFASAADPNGDGHTLAITATASAEITAGNYRYQLMAEKGSGAELERHVFEEGELVVVALIDGLAAVDARGRWQRVLDDLEAAYEDFVSTGALRSSYSIGDRSASFSTHADILAAIDRARSEVNKEKARERLRAGLRGAPKIFTRFR